MCDIVARDSLYDIAAWVSETFHTAATDYGSIVRDQPGIKTLDSYQIKIKHFIIRNQTSKKTFNIKRYLKNTACFNA